MIKLLNTDGNMVVQAKEANTVAQLRQFVATESAKSFKSFSLHVVSSPPRELKVVLDKKTLAEAGLLNGMITQVVQSAVSGGCVHGRRAGPGTVRLPYLARSRASCAVHDVSVHVQRT